MSTAHIKPPIQTVASSDDFHVRKFVAATTHKATAVHTAWAGKYVVILAVGSRVHFGFSKQSSSEISTAIAATDAGASAKVGLPIPDGTMVHVKLPLIGDSETLYFVREGEAADTVAYMALAEYIGVKLD
jgi:hypothetical protein